MTDEEAERVARGLSPAQRRWVGNNARLCELVDGSRAWITHPPTSTYHCLLKKWLIDWTGRLTEDGLRVRAILTKEQQK
jgi:hypothetical protein